MVSKVTYPLKVEQPSGLKSLVDYATEFLVEAIVSGELKPGQQVKEEEIASRLGISRPPLREALRALEMEGLVVRRPRRGVFVSDITPKDVWEIYTLKMALYSLATRLAMEKMGPREMKKLEHVVDRMETCLNKAPQEVGRYQHYHEQFHELLMEVAGNERLKRISSSLHNQVKRFSYRSLTEPEHLKRSCLYHRKILEAIKRGDVAMAEELTELHVREALEFLSVLLSQKGGHRTAEGEGELKNAVAMKS